MVKFTGFYIGYFNFLNHLYKLSLGSMQIANSKWNMNLTNLLLEDIAKFWFQWSFFFLQSIASKKGP